MTLVLLYSSLKHFASLQVARKQNQQSQWHRLLLWWSLLLCRNTGEQRIICSMPLVLISSESNESERKRTLMLEIGHLDFRTSSSSGTFWSLWTSLYICNIVVVISTVLRPNSQCTWSFFTKCKAVLSNITTTSHIWLPIPWSMASLKEDVL